jgi:hypothetical protein
VILSELLDIFHSSSLTLKKYTFAPVLKYRCILKEAPEHTASKEKLLILSQDILGEIRWN